MDMFDDLPKALPDMSVIDFESDGYTEGFDDAMAYEPLFDDASAEYRAGWLSYWEWVRIQNEKGHFKINGIWRHASQITKH